METLQLVSTPCCMQGTSKKIPNLGQVQDLMVVNVKSLYPISFLIIKKSNGSSMMELNHTNSLSELGFPIMGQEQGPSAWRRLVYMKMYQR